MLGLGELLRKLRVVQARVFFQIELKCRLAARSAPAQTAVDLWRENRLIWLEIQRGMAGRDESAVLKGFQPEILSAP